MTKTVVGYFDDFAQAEQAVRALVDGGFSRTDISLVAGDPQGQYTKKYDVARDTVAEEEGSGLAVGAGTGAVVGGLGGLLVGLGALAIPGVGPVIAAGPLGAALLGAGLGTAAGGIIGALVDIGVAEEEAGVYAEGIRRGGAVVSLRSEGLMVDRAIEIMERNGAVDIDKRAADWRSSGWTGATSAAAPDAASPQASSLRRSEAGIEERGAGRATEASVFDVYAADYRTHFAATYENRGSTYDRYEPAYRYGYTLANDKRYSSKEWSAIEADARREWEARNQGAWDDFKDAIRYAWDRVHGYSTSRAA
jgi:hypothetical protein